MSAPPPGFPHNWLRTTGPPQCPQPQPENTNFQADLNLPNYNVLAPPARRSATTKIWFCINTPFVSDTVAYLHNLANLTFFVPDAAAAIFANASGGGTPPPVFCHQVPLCVCDAPPNARQPGPGLLLAGTPSDPAADLGLFNHLASTFDWLPLRLYRDGPVAASRDRDRGAMNPIQFSTVIRTPHPAAAAEGLVTAQGAGVFRQAGPGHFDADLGDGNTLSVKASARVGTDWRRENFGSDSATLWPVIVYGRYNAACGISFRLQTPSACKRMAPGDTYLAQDPMMAPVGVYRPLWMAQPAWMDWRYMLRAKFREEEEERESRWKRNRTAAWVNSGGVSRSSQARQALPRARSSRSNVQPNPKTNTRTMLGA